MVKKVKLAKWLVILVALCAYGCTWDGALYDKFVAEEQISVCPPDRTASLSYISYLPKGAPEAITFSCPGDGTKPQGVAQGQGLSKEMRETFEDSCRHGICPKDFSCLKTENEKAYFCANDLVCPKGRTKCATGCHDLTADDNNCGDCGMVCEVVTGSHAVKMKCEKQEGSEPATGVCRIAKCLEGYHVVVGAGGNTVCEEDNAASCDGLDCSIIGGWVDGTCGKYGERGYRCTATSCTRDYHVLNAFDATGNWYACEKNDRQDCGEHGKMCEPGEGEDVVDCISTDSGALCVPTMCMDNYHLSSDDYHLNLDKLACEKDKPSACGAFYKDCAKEVVGWADGECRDRKCIVSACLVGYYKETQSGLCRLNTNFHCGTEDKACGVGEFCTIDNTTQDGQQAFCSSTCARGWTPCPEQGCVNTQVNADSCGGCGRRCAELPNARRACEKAKCVYSCMGGYGDCNGDLQKVVSDGCETNLASEGLKSCTECKTGFECGTKALAGGGSIPRCVDYDPNEYFLDKSTCSCKAGYVKCGEVMQCSSYIIPPHHICNDYVSTQIPLCVQIGSYTEEKKIVIHLPDGETRSFWMQNSDNALDKWTDGGGDTNCHASCNLEYGRKVYDNTDGFSAHLYSYAYDTERGRYYYTAPFFALTQGQESHRHYPAKKCEPGQTCRKIFKIDDEKNEKWYEYECDNTKK